MYVYRPSWRRYDDTADSTTDPMKVPRVRSRATHVTLLAHCWHHVIRPCAVCTRLGGVGDSKSKVKVITHSITTVGIAKAHVVLK